MLPLAWRRGINGVKIEPRVGGPFLEADQDVRDHVHSPCTPKGPWALSCWARNTSDSRCCQTILLTRTELGSLSWRTTVSLWPQPRCGREGLFARCIWTKYFVQPLIIAKYCGMACLTSWARRAAVGHRMLASGRADAGRSALAHINGLFGPRLATVLIGLGCRMEL